MKPLARHALALAISAVFAVNAGAATPPVRADNAWLSEADAMARSARVSNVDYVLDFAITGKETFSGATTMSFDLADTNAPLTIDLDKASIAHLEVNGKALTPQYNNFFITIPAEALVKGKNTVVVAFQRLHSTNGEGLHRMVDPADGKVYTYSHFEPAAAHQMFALFDQPDLKATYQVNVTVPADWQVISTTRENAVQDVPDGKRWTFPKTKKLSPYNFSLHAGPYKVWEDTTSGPYPMRVFARQSVASQVKPADWFRYTAQGLKFFDGYFGIPYQFEKYDQLLVPDFLYGAMENAGAVTFAERGFLYKAEMTEGQRQVLASVIMHEMAHQWFGDLVTMKWWNGLWLNESFASFMGTLATAEATEFKNAWQSFYSSAKTGAYAKDQSLSTHPIEVPVPSTANAFDNIDAITYSKGASTLKQLRHLLGEETFRKGVHNYLVKYQFQNARLEDFIGSLGEAAGRDLKPWTQEWLYKAGVDTITANYSCAGGKIKTFALQQSAPSNLPTLREQRVQVATFNVDGGKVKLGKNVAVTYQGAKTAVPELVGAACPDLVYPNYQDWGFAKVQLDKRSFATAQTSLAKVDDPLLRSMLWQSLWDGVREGKLPLNDFIKTALANAGAERDYTLLGEVLGMISYSKYYLEAMQASGPYAQKTRTAFEDQAWAGVQANTGDSNFLRRWFSHYQAVASSKPALDRLAAILDGKLVVPNLNVSQDVRWSIITRLNRFDYPGSAALIESEQARDKSDSGQAAAVTATVVRPDPKIKSEWLAKVSDPKSGLPFARARVAMASLFPVEQRALSEASAAERLAKLPVADKEGGPVFVRGYSAMIPSGCTAESVKRLDAATASFKDLSAGTHRTLLETREEDKRCLTVRQAMTVPKS